MTLVIAITAAALSLVVGVELLRWTFRPEARRLRLIKKIGGRR